MWAFVLKSIQLEALQSPHVFKDKCSKNVQCTWTKKETNHKTEGFSLILELCFLFNFHSENNIAVLSFLQINCMNSNCLTVSILYSCCEAPRIVPPC